MFENKVSVIMPTYRRDYATVYRAVTSIVNQTYNNIELLIIDDNNDSSCSEQVLNVIKDSNDNRIHYHKNTTNMGSAKSRNKGIELAIGRYITFLDDDDEYLPEKVEKQVYAMVTSNADYSITNLELYNEKNELVRSRIHSYINSEPSSLLIKHLKYHLTGTDSMMFKNEYITSIGMFEEIDLGDEFYLMLKAINGAGKFVYVDRCDIKAYIHSNGEGLTNSNKRLEAEEILYNRKKEYFNQLHRCDINFIKMRHNLVIGSIYLKKKNLLLFFVYFFKSLISSPKNFIKLILNRKEY